MQVFSIGPQTQQQQQVDHQQSSVSLLIPDSICPYPPIDITKVSVHEIRQPEGTSGTFCFCSYSLAQNHNVYVLTRDITIQENVA
jgi:hypothetical protein